MGVLKKTTSVMKVFNLPEKRVDELRKEASHALIDSKDMEELGKRLGLDKAGEDGLKGYLFALIVMKNEGCWK